MINGRRIHELLIQIGEEQDLGAIACVAISENMADSQFMHKRSLTALHVLAITLRELAAHVDEAIAEIEAGEPEEDSSSSN